jgi:hypothetical protein
MGQLLHVLIINGSATDTQLIVEEIQHAGYNVQHQYIKTLADMQQALQLMS